MSVVNCLVSKVKVHAGLWFEYVNIELAVRGKVLHRPRTDDCVLILRERERERVTCTNTHTQTQLTAVAGSSSEREV